MKKRLLYACHHSCLDPSNGAAITAREILKALAEKSWDVRVLCGPAVDDDGHVLQLLADNGITRTKTVVNTGAIPFSLVHYRDGNIPSTIFLPGDDFPSRDASDVFFKLSRRLLEDFHCDILLSYGGHGVGPRLFKAARKKRVATVVLLQNLAYNDRTYFDEVDLVIVPSEFARRHYADKLGLATVPVPPLMAEATATWCDDPKQRRYLTFVNPEPGKGLALFLRIVKTLNAVRPDIPVLLVEGRGKSGLLSRNARCLHEVKTIHVMKNTPDPADFMCVTKIMLVPSYYEETFGRIAAEAMANGIPVLASSRGALPEVLGDAGFLFDIPSSCLSDPARVPTSESVEPWVRTILRLWDRPGDYESASERGRMRSRVWKYAVVAEQYDRIFSSLIKPSILI